MLCRSLLVLSVYRPNREDRRQSNDDGAHDAFRMRFGMAHRGHRGLRKHGHIGELLGHADRQPTQRYAQLMVATSGKP